MWDVGSGRELQRTPLGNEVSALAVSAGGLVAVATGALGGKPDPIALREIDSGRVVATLAGHTQRVQGLAFDPAGRVLALTGQDGVVRLWDVATGAMLAALAGHSQFVMDVSFSTDGQLLASVDAAGNVILWNVADHSRVRQSTSADSAHGVRSPRTAARSTPRGRTGSRYGGPPSCGRSASRCAAPRRAQATWC